MCEAQLAAPCLGCMDTFPNMYLCQVSMHESTDQLVQCMPTHTPIPRVIDTGVKTHARFFLLYPPDQKYLLLCRNKTNPLFQSPSAGILSGSVLPSPAFHENETQALAKALSLSGPFSNS